MNSTSESPASIVVAVVDDAVQIVRAKLQEKFGSQFIALVQFGSTTRGSIKQVTDLDLFVVLDINFRSLSEKRDATRVAEDAGDQVLKKLVPLGYFIAVSCIVRSKEQAQQFSPLYLDMTLYSKIHFDVGGFAQSVISKTQQRILETGAVRKQRGLMWYWDLAPNFKPGDKVEFF